MTEHWTKTALDCKTYSPSAQDDQVLDLADIHWLSVRDPLLSIILRVLDGQSNNLAVHFQIHLISYSAKVKWNQSNKQDQRSKTVHGSLTRIFRTNKKSKRSNDSLRCKIEKNCVSYVSHIHSSHSKHTVPDLLMYVRTIQHWNYNGQ